MPSPRLARLLASAAAVAGAGLLGTALGGMATVDRELAASVAPAPVVQVDRIAYEPGAVAAPVDCPRPRTAAREL